MIKITKQGWAVIENDSHIGKWVQETKRLDFDQNVLPLMRKFIKRGDIIIDIGANIGCYTWGLYDIIEENGKAICFEPNIETFECLKHNLSKYSNIELHNMAIGSKKGYVQNVCQNDNIGMSYVIESDKGVQINTLDSFNLDKCNFIKIDVEGYELDVLKGAEKTLKKFHPYLFIEINDHTLTRVGIHRSDIFNYLHDIGYEFRNIYPKQNMNDSQLDIICY